MGTPADATKLTADDFNKKIKEAGIEGVVAKYDAANKKVSFETTAVGKDASLKVKSTIDAATNDAVITAGVDATITVAGKTITGKGNSIEIKDEVEGAQGLQIDVVAKADKTTIAKGDVTLNSVGANLQIGANEGQNIALSIGDMRAEALGVNDIDVSDAKKADATVTTIQSAIDKVSTERSKLGAYQNRLEHTINNLSTSSENLQAAESRVRDVDMAKEMMSFSKNNILQQAAQAMLSQANQQPQGVLQLLR